MYHFYFIIKIDYFISLLKRETFLLEVDTRCSSCILFPDVDPLFPEDLSIQHDQSSRVLKTYRNRKRKIEDNDALVLRKEH